MTSVDPALASKHPQATAFFPPYAPSWFDRFTDWVDRLPVPAWLTYLLFGAVVMSFEVLVQWREGGLSRGNFRAADLWSHGFLAYQLLLLHYLDKLAANSLSTFRPLLIAESSKTGSVDGSYQNLRYRLTTLPPWPTAIAAVVGTLMALMAYIGSVSTGVTPNFLVGIAGTPVSTIAFMISFVPSNAILGVLLYHTIHQLVIISQIYTRHARLNLYQLQPFYALSRPGAITTLGLFAVVALFILTGPTEASQTGGTRPLEVAIGTLFALIAGLTFFLPLWGAHRRIVNEKARRVGEAAARFEVATQQLHLELDSGQLDNMNNLNRALASLETEQEVLRKIPAWPWEAGVARSVIFALLFPLVTWVLQLLLARVLGA